jgi:hypothetical protein
MGDAIVQTCGKAGRVFTKWARRMTNVPCAVPANWTSWPENEDYHEYGYAGKDAWLGEIRVRYISTELNWADVLTKALVPKKNKDALETIIGSKEAYRLTVTQKGVLVQYADSYFLLATYA